MDEMKVRECLWRIQGAVRLTKKEHGGVRRVEEMTMGEDRVKHVNGAGRVRGQGNVLDLEMGEEGRDQVYGIG